MSNPESIWKIPITVEQMNTGNQASPNMVNLLGIEFTEIGPDYMRATMPVNERTRQNMGLLHGGASVVLAETLGSVAANLATDPKHGYCLGLEINCNHLRSKAEGIVTATARPIRIGRTTHVWNIEIADEKGELVAISRLTMAVRLARG